MNSRNVSSYFHRLKITRSVHFFTLFLNGNAATGERYHPDAYILISSKPLIYL